MPGLDDVKHKRRIVLDTKPEDALPAGGKRTYTLPSMYQAEGDFLQGPMRARHEQVGGNLRETRFHKGFARRPAGVIAQDVQRKEQEAARMQRKDERSFLRRDYLTTTGNKNGLNPLTGGEPIIGTPHDGGRAKLDKQGLRTHHTIQRMTEEPVDVERLRLKAARRVIRREKIAQEGLVQTKKEWSVADQMSCYDGFAVNPDISWNGTRRAGATQNLQAPRPPSGSSSRLSDRSGGGSGGGGDIVAA